MRMMAKIAQIASMDMKSIEFPFFILVLPRTHSPHVPGDKRRADDT